jgi:hypothetical protein
MASNKGRESKPKIPNFTDLRELSLIMELKKCPHIITAPNVTLT